MTGNARHLHSKPAARGQQRGWGSPTFRAAVIGLSLAAPACDRGREPAARDRPSEGSSAAPKASEPPAATSTYSVPELTPDQLSRAFRTACRRARDAGELVLVEFSANWCRDCRALAKMKREPALADALGRVEQVVVNVGEFDRHAELLGAFGVRAIARWELLAPGDCEAPPQRWPRRGSRTLEPESGQRPVAPDDLARWLEARRPS